MFRLLRSYVHDGLVALGVRDENAPEEDVALNDVPDMGEAAMDAEHARKVNALFDEALRNSPPDFKIVTGADEAREDEPEPEITPAGLVRIEEDVPHYEPAEAIMDREAEFLARPLRPELRNLRPELYEPWGRRDAEDYSFLHTIGKKFGVPDERIAEAQESYARKVENGRMWISRPNEIEGWRQLVVIGPGLASAMGRRKNDHAMVLGVNDEGRYFEFEAERPGMHAIARILNGALDPIRAINTDFNFNRHSKDWRSMIYQAGEELGHELFNYSGSYGVASYAAPRKANGMAHALVAQRVKRAFGIATFALREKLDPELRRIMHGTQMTTAHAVKWLSGTKADNVNWRDRLQAARSYPILTRLMQEDYQLARAIDAREPLAPAIARVLNVPEKGVRNLVGLTWQKTGSRPLVMDDIVWFVANLNRNHVPSSKAEFRALRQLEQLARHVRLPLADVVDKFSKAGRGGPWAHVGRTSDASVPDICDFLMAVTDKLLVPVRMNGMKRQMEADRPLYAPQKLDRSEIMKELFHALSVSDMIAGSERWHRNIMRHDDKTQTLGRSHEWPALFGAKDYGSLTAREVTSSNALIAIGRAEQHCVGGYDRAVLGSSRDNSTVIFTLTNSSGSIAGTLEMQIYLNRSRRDRAEAQKQAAIAAGDAPREALVGDSHDVRIVQNRSKRNGPVSEAADKAAHRVIADIAAMPQTRLDEWLAEIGQINRIRLAKNNMPVEISYAEFNIWQPDEMQAAWEEYSVYLPRRMRKAGLDGLIDAQPAIAHEEWMGRDAPEGRAWWETQCNMVNEISSEKPPSVVTEMLYIAANDAGQLARVHAERDRLVAEVEATGQNVPMDRAPLPSGADLLRFEAIEYIGKRSLSAAEEAEIVASVGGLEREDRDCKHPFIQNIANQCHQLRAMLKADGTTQKRSLFLDEEESEADVAPFEVDHAPF